DIVTSLLRLPSKSESELWLTPIYMQLANGVVTLKRSDALVDNMVQIATWGTVDLINDRVDMAIGILGDGLRRALRLENISPNYVLQLPLRGTTATASIDKTRAAAKIAALTFPE